MSSPSAAPDRSLPGGEETKGRSPRKRVTVTTTTALSLLEACGLASPSRPEEAAVEGKKAPQGETPAGKVPVDGLEAQQTASPVSSRKRDSGQKKKSAPDRDPRAVVDAPPEEEASQSVATMKAALPEISPVAPSAGTAPAAVPPEPAISPKKESARRRAGSATAAPVPDTGTVPVSRAVEQVASPAAGPSGAPSAVEAVASVPGEEQSHAGAKRAPASRRGRPSASGGRGRKETAAASPVPVAEAVPAEAPMPGQAPGRPMDAAALAAEADRLAAEYGLSSSGGGLVVLPGDDDGDDLPAPRGAVVPDARATARSAAAARSMLPSPAAPVSDPVPVEASASSRSCRAGSTTAAPVPNSGRPSPSGAGSPGALPASASAGYRPVPAGSPVPASGAAPSLSDGYEGAEDANGSARPGASPVAAGGPCSTPSSGTGMGRREAAFRQWAADMQARFDAGLEAEEARAARRKEALVVLPPPTDTGGRKRRTAKKTQAAAGDAPRPRAWITRRRSTEPGHEARFEEWHGPERTESVLEKVFISLGASPEQAKLSRLWCSWDAVLGPDLAPLARPLGHHDDRLLIGAGDAVLLQELYYMGPEIVRRVNAFLQEDFFTAVRVSLMLDHQDLDAPSPVLERSAGRPKEEVPAPSGASLGLMDPESAVARCYARFLGMELPDPRH